MSTALSIWTVVVTIIFIGIVIWVWSGRNREKYEQAAQIPFNEGNDGSENGNNDKDGDLNDG